MYPYHNNSLTQSQYRSQTQKKSQLVDQNFANNTLFMTLSDIEAI